MKKKKPFGKAFTVTSLGFGSLPFFTSANSLFQKIPQFLSNSSLDMLNMQLHCRREFKKEKKKDEQCRQRIFIEAEFRNMYHATNCILKDSRDFKNAHLLFWCDSPSSRLLFIAQLSFISSSVDKGSNNPANSLSVKGADIFLWGL